MCRVREGCTETRAHLPSPRSWLGPSPAEHPPCAPPKHRGAPADHFSARQVVPRVNLLRLSLDRPRAVMLRLRSGHQCGPVAGAERAILLHAWTKMPTKVAASGGSGAGAQTIGPTDESLERVVVQSLRTRGSMNNLAARDVLTANNGQPAACLLPILAPRDTVAWQPNALRMVVAPRSGGPLEQHGDMSSTSTSTQRAGGKNGQDIGPKRERWVRGLGPSARRTPVWSYSS